ncbi:MAG: response regulator [Spirochaetaceae bacterium]|jgi:signal transduction histidine kinase/DNA-binding response OmpR family regulator|nr:response regulator [Spirochaetaceae bacterium]
MTPLLFQIVTGAFTLTGIGLLILIVAAWGQPHLRSLMWFALLVTVNIAGYYLELSSDSPGAALAYYRIRYFALPFLGLTAFFFALDYSGCPLKNNPLKVALLVFPAAVSLLVLAGAEPSVFYARDFIPESRGLAAGRFFYRGILVYGNYIYNSFFQILCLIILIRTFIRTKRGWKHNVVFISVCALLPLSKIPASAVFAGYEAENAAQVLHVMVIYIYVVNSCRCNWRSLGWNSVVGKLPDAVIVINGEQKIVNVNSVFHSCFPSFSYTENISALPEFTGYLRGRLLEAYPLSLFDDLDAWWKSPVNGTSLPRQNHGEFTIGPKRQSFSIIWQDIYDGKRLAGQAIVLNDVSSYRNMIAQIVELKQKAEIASRSKTEFLATMSHEIRTPLNAIIGFSEILLQRRLPEECHADLEKIYNSGSVLLGIVSDILDISKIETGKLELVPVTYTVSSMVSDTVNLNLIRIGAKPIEFELTLDPSIPAKLLGDELRVKQILNNLLSNAIKYTHKGKVSLDIKWERGDGDIAILTFVVKDTGQGIKKEDQGKLFARYSQLNMQANRKVEGTGLGLSITMTLTALMGGSITVESEYGVGSVFTVVIRQEIVDNTPIGEDTVENMKRFRSTDSRGDRRKMIRTSMPGARVLVVDDVQTNIDVARGLMTAYELTVDGALSGQEAIDLIRAGEPRYDIIFMDHMMPEMDGIQTTQVIRLTDSDYARKVPIVALTANALAGNRDMFIENGINDFLAKPVEIQKLTAILERWIPKEKQQRREGYPDQEETERETMPGIPGVDVDAGLANTGNSVATYKKILSVFCADVDSRISRIEEASRAEDLSLYTTLVHALKGASRSIGAAAFGDQAALLEDAGRSGSRSLVETETGRLLKSLSRLKNHISAVLEEEPPPDFPGDGDKTDYSALNLGALKEALIAMDTGAVNGRLQSYAPLELNGTAKAFLGEIEQHILLFDYDKAVAKIDEVLQR